MNLPEPPATFRRPSAAERPWAWRLEDDAAAEVPADSLPEELAGQRFANQGDAESWVGEVWPVLAEAGVAQVVLLEHERVVYGPMSLRA